MDIITVSSIVVTAIATAFIAFYSYKSGKLALEMNKLTKANEEFSKQIQESSNKAFWGIVFSNIASDKANRKERLGFIIKLFGWDAISSSLDIDKENVKDVINSNCEKFVDQIIFNKD